MDARKENTFSMQRSVVSFNLTVPETIKALMPDYVTLLDELENKNAQIGTLNGLQSSSNKGFHADKIDTKAELIELTLDVVAACRALALKQKNNVLLAKMDQMQKSKLERARDSTAADYCEEVHNIAFNIQPDIQPYGVTVTTLAELSAKLTLFREELSKPRNKIVSRKQINREIGELFIECAEILENLDALVNTVARRQPAFKNEYYDNRKIIDYHGKKLSLRGFVYDVNGLPIENVEVTALNAKLSTLTTSKGYFEFKSLPAGLDSFTFNKVQFQTVNQAIGIVKNERIDINITMANASSQKDSA